MRYQGKLFIIVFVLLLLLSASLPGCIEVVRQQQDSSQQAPVAQPAAPATPSSGAPEMPGQRPAVTAFSASPESITKGQSVTLNWNVEGATTVTIQPYVGAVQPSGNKVLPLSNSTTFTLTATNASGNTVGTVTVMVGAAPTGVPDLAVTDIWVQGDTVYYKVMNYGGLDSMGGTSRLYIENMEKDTDYIDQVPAGQEITGNFGKYAFVAPGGLSALAGGLTGTPEVPWAIEVKVCVDTDDATKESDEFNNCYIKLQGNVFTYDMPKNAHQAIWKSGYGTLKWPTVGSDSRGAAFLSNYQLEDGRSYGNTLAMYPQQVSFGSIQGTFGEPSQKQLGMESGIKEMVLPPNAKFSARLGFKEGSSKTDGVTASFGIVDQSGLVNVIKSMPVMYDNKLDLFEVGLGAYANQKVMLVLRVEAGQSWEDDNLVWVNPIVTQELQQ